jgi:hypothetical protein
MYALITAFRSIFVLLLVVGCSVAGNPIADSAACSDWSRTFFRKPMKDQATEFLTFNLSKQYAVFICGNQTVHPPAMHLAEPFAMGGPTTAEFLKSRIAETNDDLTISDIVFVFKEMSRKRTFDAAGDPDLIRLLMDKTGHIENQHLRGTAQRALSEIGSTNR